MAADTILYKDPSLDNFIDQLNDVNINSTCYLTVLAGPNEKDKNHFLKKISERVAELNRVDLRSIISIDEEKSFQNINDLFKSIQSGSKTLYFSHGDILSGEYTGFTYSSNRYATPQEKYLLKKIRASEKIVFLDLHDMENITPTLSRYTQKIIRFDRPNNLLGKLKQIHVHGSSFINKRQTS